MTLYIVEKKAGRRRSEERHDVHVLCLAIDPSSFNDRDILVRWPFDGSEKRRQEVLRYIERWATEHNITIGNPELWSMPPQRAPEEEVH